MLNDLRDRIVVQVDGQLKTGRDVVDRRAARRRGVRLRHRAAGGDGLRDDARLPSEHLPGRHRHAGSRAAQEVHRQARVRRRLSSASSPRKCASCMAALGFRTLDEMVGRADCLDVAPAIEHWKAEGLDLTPLLHQPPLAAGTRPARRRARRTPDSTRVLDHELIAQAGAGARCADAGRARRCRSATPIAPIGTHARLRGDQALRRRRAARRHDPHRLHRLGRARASAPSCRAASRWRSKATPTTTSARACRAAG